MSGAFYTLLIVIFMLKTIVSFLDIIYRTYTEKDLRVSWKEQVVSDVCFGLFYLFVLLGLLLGW